jgi:hypothetical protein
MVQLVKISDTFRAGFYAALGKVVVASGRVEYELKLCLKSLLGQGFTIGMAQAESDPRFSKLCERIKELAAKKLSEPHRSAFIRQVEKAEKQARERNDHVHALWTAGQGGNALRLRPFWDKNAKKVSWSRNRRVRISELNKLAAKSRRLQRAINKARRFTWPKVS